MAKKKKSQQQQQENNQETDTQPRDQMNTLQKSNEELESEITKKFEKEKKEIEDQVMEEVKAEFKKEFDLSFLSNPKQRSMGKKKQPQQQHECRHHAQEIEDPTEKLLNGILLKKTVEYRLEINTLKKSKEELEYEITKTQKLKTKNKELEGSLMEVKEANQLKKRMIKEKLNEIQQLKLRFDGVLQDKSELQDETNKLKISVDQLNRDLVRERDVVSEIEKKLDLQVNKSKNLKVQISDLEKNQVPIQKKLSEIEMENEKLVQDKKDGKKTLELVKSEKKAVEKKLAESLKAFDELKQDMERIVLQKENIEKNRNYQLAKIDDLEKKDKMLRKKFDELDKGYSDALQKQQQLQLEFASLERNDKMLRYKVAEENKERDEAFHGLMSEKVLIEKKFVDLGKIVEELKREKEEIALEKNMADQAVKADLENMADQAVKWRKGYTEALEKQQLLRDELDSERQKFMEIVEEKDVIKMKMENRLGVLEMSVSQLEKSYNDQIDANQHLESEVGSLNGNLKSVAAEKSEIQRELELKKMEESGFSLKVKELQKIVDDTMKENEELKKGTGLLSVEMKKLETLSEMLIQEKSLLEKKLVEAEMGNQSLASKMMSAQLNATKALLMLKDAAGIVGGAEDEEKDATEESVIDMKKIEEDIITVASELESIGNAFKNKDKKMEELTHQIEKVNKSAKKNSKIWALVSILAAAAATYIARGH